jgi:hypothetical protein
MECNCSYTDYDGADLSNEVIRKAAKPHKCCECGDVIDAGERYEYASGMWEGMWYAFKTCRGCLNMRRRFCPDGWLYGGLREAVAECVGFDPYTLPTQADVDDEDDER